MSKALQRPTLVLNRNWQSVKVATVARALVLLLDAAPDNCLRRSEDSLDQRAEENHATKQHLPLWDPKTNRLIVWLW